MYFAVRAVGESVSGSNVVTLIIQIAVGGVVYILLGGSYLLYLRKKNAR
jgi:hypothetical protein